jgi:hypothetical protein
MLDVVMYAYEHPEGVRRGDVAAALDLDPRQASVYLSRAVAANRLKRAERVSICLLSVLHCYLRTPPQITTQQT